jgi:hypothetical protein
MKHALAMLPPNHLFHFVRVIREDSGHLGYSWILEALEWEIIRRDSGDPGDFPAHGLAPGQLSDAVGMLWAFAARIRANPDGKNLWPIVNVLDEAVAQLTREMKPDVERMP